MLKICYLSDNPIRLKNSRQILESMELGNVIDRRKDRFLTMNAEYVFVNCRNADEYMGLYTDQAVIDYREPIIKIAKMITAKSCVPDRYRIIDDRKIGTSDF